MTPDAITPAAALQKHGSKKAVGLELGISANAVGKALNARADTHETVSLEPRRTHQHPEED